MPLPKRNFGPDHNAVAVGGALHALVVGIVSEADKVSVEVFEIAEDGGDVLVGVEAAAADGGFGVEVDALQVDGLTVEQDAGAVDADVAKADVVGELVLLSTGACGEGDFVELGRCGRTRRSRWVALTVKGARPSASVVRVVLTPASGMVRVTGVPRGSVDNVDVAGEFGVAGLPGWAVGEMDVVVVNEGLREGDEGDVAGEAAVVEPVDADRWDGRPGGRVASTAMTTKLAPVWRDGGGFAVEGACIRLRGPQTIALAV